MSDARWRRVQDLYHAALERPAPVRAEFLSDECAGDAGLLHEVQSLLDQPISADQFLVAGASSPSDTSSLRIGQLIDVYQVKAFIDRGGMGEVYRACDTKLGRDVALKVLPARFTADRDRLARFEREARMLATLNHPHIGAIYGFENEGSVCEVAFTTTEADGRSQIWLASLDRRTPARWIARGGDQVSFGPDEDLIFRSLDEMTSTLVRIKKDGTAREPVTTAPILYKGAVSADGEWVVAQLARERGAYAIPSVAARM